MQKSKKKYKIGRPDKNKHLVLWTAQEYNAKGEMCAVCGGIPHYRHEGYNEKTGRCYVLHACKVLECSVEAEMRIFMEIK